MKHILKQVTPPVLWEQAHRAAKLVRDRRRPQEATEEEAEVELFDGEAELFIEAVTSAQVYGEYGMGASTRWVARHSQAKIAAVDTAWAWVEDTRRRIDDDRHSLKWVDVGPVENFGMPCGFSKRHAFRDYVDAIWIQEEQPDVILIDGRFRLSCWFESVLRARAGTRIIFDDYVERQPFHIVEDYLRPERTNGRQALFVVPGGMDHGPLAEARDAFLMVRD